MALTLDPAALAWSATLLAERAAWQAQARCRGIDPEVFFDPELWPQARRVCRQCPVRADCLTHAIAAQECRGIWGGLTPAERRRHRTDGQRSIPTPPVSTSSGPARRISDLQLTELLTAADPTTPAIDALRASTDLARSSLYVYLGHARRLGIIERRGTTDYPTRTANRSAPA